MSRVANNLLAAGIVIAFILLMYSTWRQKSITEVFDEIKKLMGGKDGK